MYSILMIVFNQWLKMYKAERIDLKIKNQPHKLLLSLDIFKTACPNTTYILFN